MTDTIYDFIDSSPVGSAGDIVYGNDKCELATYSPHLIQSLYSTSIPVTGSDWAERGKVSRDYAIAHHNHHTRSRRVAERHIEVTKNYIADLELKKAYNCYSRAIKTEPTNPEHYFGRAEVLDWSDFKRSKRDNDICILSEAILPLPKLSPIWKKIRYGNNSLGRPGLSVPWIAWRAKYGNRKFYGGKRMMYSYDLMDCRRHRHISLKQGATDDIATAISLDPDNAKYYFLQYNIRYGTSFTDRFNLDSDRFQLLLKAISLDPGNDDYLETLLHIHKRRTLESLSRFAILANRYRYTPDRKLHETPPEYTTSFVTFVTKTTKYNNRPPVKRKGPRPFWER